MTPVRKIFTSLPVMILVLFSAVPAVPTLIEAVPEKILTVEKCISLALENSDFLKSYRSGLQSSSARISAAEAELDPQLNLTGSWTGYSEEQRLAPANYDGQRGSYDDQTVRGSLELRLPLTTGGRVENRVSQAEYVHESETERVARLEQEVSYEVSVLYYSIYAVENRLRSLRGAEKSLKSHYTRIDNLVTAAKAAPIDLKRMEVELSSIVQQKIKAEGDLRQLYLALSRLMKVDYHKSPYRIESTLEAATGLSSLDKLIERARKSRPDLAASVASLKAAESGLKAAQSLDNPTVSITGSFSASANTEGGDDTSGYVGLRVDFPLWDGGLAAARTEEAEGERQKVHYAREDLLSRIDLQVESALTDLTATIRRIEVTSRAIESAAESLRIEKLKHEMNKGTVTEVLQAQAALLNAESEHAVALAENRIAESELRLATGEMENDS